jgi:hypothetical protein
MLSGRPKMIEKSGGLPLADGIQTIRDHDLFA